MSSRRISSDNGRWIGWTIFLAFLLCLIVLCSIYVVRLSITTGVITANDSFHNEFENSKIETYTQYHDLAYDYSEKRHHVRNKVAISIGAIKEKSSLEVLKVSDVVYIISDPADTNAGTSAWLKVYGTGVFTVNLTEAEYVIDSERQYVLVRVPRPLLESGNINLDSYEILHFKENVWNPANSIESGENLLQNQIIEAKQQIQEDFKANEQYSKFAEESTKSMLAALIKGLNPDIDNLVVEVEFYEEI